MNVRLILLTCRIVALIVVNREERSLSSVAERVRDFYERNPYPPPIDRLDGYRQLWQDTNRRLADYHLFWPSGLKREDRSILVAGCGTSQAAKYAVRWPSAKVVGVDFSAKSVRCTEELKTKYDLQNLQVRQLSIEHVQDLGTEFDQIICTGVLHHLTDPDAGLRALRNMLKPDGAMHLMVYAPYGRAGIYLLQEFCRRMDIHATQKEIQDLATALRMLPQDHPLERLLREVGELQEDTGIADALLHPNDRAYSVPQLFELIKRGGLIFGRWIRQAPYSSKCGDISKIPQASRLAQLPLEEQFAAIELFRGTMVEHSLVLYRNDGPSRRQQVTFSGEAWRGYVPIRMSDTVCIQERLPAGAAAILINQNHIYRDLIMPIDSIEKRLFDSIDGNSSIDEIMQKQACSLDRACSLFDRLWWYDQVVFQTGAN